MFTSKGMAYSAPALSVDFWARMQLVQTLKLTERNSKLNSKKRKTLYQWICCQKCRMTNVFFFFIRIEIYISIESFEIVHSNQLKLSFDIRKSAASWEKKS
jgi:hypothetical protein